MNRKIKVGSGGRALTLTNKQYLAAGGEGEIYVDHGMAYKLYFDPDNKMLPKAKMQELAAIGNPQIVVPSEVIFDANNGKAIGYTTKFVDNVEPLLKLFTKTFKDSNGIDPVQVAELVKRMQTITNDIHKAHCLVVDYNELNILVALGKVLTPWYIDTDSYATPSFKATAIMDSVRDRKATRYDSSGDMHYDPTILSDWFSWGVLTFWLYSNIHPFRGGHKNYKPKDKKKQMDDGVSVFHKDVRVPPFVNDFSLIPKRHLEWYKAVFGKGERSVPPMPDAMIPVLPPTAIITIKGTDKLTVDQIGITYPDPIVDVFPCMGLNYVVTKGNTVYADKKKIRTFDKAGKVVVFSAPNGSMVAAAQYGDIVKFHELNSGLDLGSVAGRRMFLRNNCVYTVSGGQMIENSFRNIGIKLIHITETVENVSQFSTMTFDGCAIQDLLGKKYLTIPYDKKTSFSKYIPALDGFRIVDAKSEKYVTVVLAEKGGIYHRFIIVFSNDYQSFEVREVKDVAYEAINFTTMDNGLCLLLANQNEIELFKKADKYETLTDPPFDANMQLFSTIDGIFFINGTSIHQVKRK